MMPKDRPLCSCLMAQQSPEQIYANRPTPMGPLTQLSDRKPGRTFPGLPCPGSLLSPWAEWVVAERDVATVKGRKAIKEGNVNYYY